jgi:two-component system response regulator AtoC
MQTSETCQLESLEAGVPLPYLVGSAKSSKESSVKRWNEELESVLEQVSPFDVPVLIQGETGAGKEIVARMLHARSRRWNKPFLKLNCAALPAELIESELFGYERGAFTGANKSTPGKFELANGGTIFLDEIGDMDVSLQAKLLQVLQDREYLPLGAREPIRVDVRIIAATHRDLEEAIEIGQFREDLYYRLDVFNIKVPPLRERKEDILELAQVLLERHSIPDRAIPEVTPQLEEALLTHTWPGNVRELENLMRRFLICADAEVLEAELWRRMRTCQDRTATTVEMTPKSKGAASRTGLPDIKTLRQNRDAEEARVILSVLASTRWNRKQAARSLGMDYKALLYRMKRLGIDGANEGNPLQVTDDPSAQPCPMQAAAAVATQHQ